MTVDVAIVGSGPNGMMLACELALAGVRPTVLERLPERSAQPKANGIIGQAVRLLDHRGLYQRLRTEEPSPAPIPSFLFGGLPLDLTRLRDNPMYGLGVSQQRLEQELEERARELGVEIRRGAELVGLAQDDREVVGCDGGRSTVRKQAGIDFPGATATDSVSRTAHVEIPGARIVPGTVDLETPEHGRIGLYTWTRTERGAYVILPAASGAMSVSSIEWGGPPVDEDVAMTIGELRSSLRRVLGFDLPLAAPASPGPHLLRRLSARNTRLAQTYRSGRVLLAGDAAHVHSAMGEIGRAHV